MPPPSTENSTRLEHDNYFGAGYVQGKQNAVVDRHLYTTPVDTCPYPDPPYESYCKGYHVAYDFNWRTFLHPIKPYKTLAIDQREETILSNIGIVLDNLGNHTGAIRYYDKALVIDPKYALALIDKGIALYRLGNHTEAIELYDKALAIQPNNTYALNNKGAALNNLGDYAGAIRYYDKTLAIDPKNTYALTNKDAILDKLGNYTNPRNASKFLEHLWN
jgi:tetratricopeptide (TPR) repeat protein